MSEKEDRQSEKNNNNDIAKDLVIEQIKTDLRAAKYRFWGLVTAAIIGLIGVSISSYTSYYLQVKIPISFTQTAVAVQIFENSTSTNTPPHTKVPTSPATSIPTQTQTPLGTVIDVPKSDQNTRFSYPMTIGFLGLMLSNISIGLAYINLVRSQKVRRPLLLTFIIEILVTTGSILFLYVLRYQLTAYIILLFFNFAFLIVLYGITKSRDRGGIIFSEIILKNSMEIDLQIAWVLDQIIDNRIKSEIYQGISTSITYILRIISTLLGLEDAGNHIAVLVADSGKFKMVSSAGLTLPSIKYIEDNFSYQDPPVGLAGYAISKSEIISIPDMQNGYDHNYEKWVRLSSRDKAKGSVIAIPIFRSFSASSNSIGALTITTTRKNAFGSGYEDLFELFTSKIGILLMIKESIEKNSHMEERDTKYQNGISAPKDDDSIRLFIHRLLQGDISIEEYQQVVGKNKQ